MPKMKTNKSASKRFKVTKTGKIKRHKAFASHLKTHKSAKRRRNLRKADILEPEDMDRVKRMLPYG
ncbi:MAG TPA: 50S ribosomal protein L35 [Candidatus Hydrogenedentes bacterium]|jgi:large subunit ribosomal protein L35|nr:50S ribosomal protein L35 [Candidatus Hydrogenedentota bacterium]MDY0031754.1 50S ribosomal protein L35 [FCB group bacterium]NLT62497.1 50S ribosomal protein L35 [Candidatus Hydrogenedentota bacterium]HNZ19196.1 50S ribosomal protein L35 [Candidatus Hydrogenedentota bacterium]HOH32834.1 50S ribosomal protein L35 [Candidatus Hydrogenedentota bacterium]